MASHKFSLEDKYTVLEGQIAITGVQALVRLPIDQHRRDQAAGIRTGTYISGYQGSPLGELDKQLRAAGRVLGERDVVFQAGINEDVAATAIYGTQLLDTFPSKKFDGIVGMWYGKGPGIDRTGDAFRHANYIGTSKHGAAIALGGDDPACKSSTIPSDSVVAFYDVSFPTLFPADTREVLEYGLHAFAMSRFSGLWCALKIVTNVADGGGIIEVFPELAQPRIPELEIGGQPFEKHQGISLIPPFTVEFERQIHYERMLAARTYVRANKLDRIVVSSSSDRIGLISAGKSFIDMMHALELLGFGEEELKQAGIRVYKLGMIAPIEPEGLAEFAAGLEVMVVVEEKRGFSETLIRDSLYNRPSHPAVYGKLDEHDRPLFPVHNELQVDQIARILADFLGRKLGRPDLPERVKWLFEIEERQYEEVVPRTPYFCSGCPHNTSTNLPEGDIAGGGIGCHAMAMYMNRGIAWLTHMGGEGAPWMGLAPFVDRDHIFQNVGDGTYYHSASKSIQACIASGVNMTFKLLYNAAVAMTGGQEVIGVRSPIDLARQLEADGVSEVVIVPEDMDRYPKTRISPKIRVAPKADYNQVMLDIKKVPGVTVILFDQQCAAQKRRQRKRGQLETPKQRVFINEAVCEGCGDCGVKSNCLSVVPIETDYGRKTAIHQSSCNMDYSCLQGDCPSFMTVELAEGTVPARKKGVTTGLTESPPEPAHKRDAAAPYKLLLVGIGGTGVVTADQLLVTAVQIDGKHAVHLDQTGLAQKGGAVVSNLIIADRPVHHSNKVTAGEADLLLAFDLLASVAADNLNRFRPERTVVVGNTTKISTAQEITDVKFLMPGQNTLVDRLNRYTQKEKNLFFDFEAISEALFGNPMSNNVFMLGAAYQAGLLPLQANSIEEAIAVNGVAVEQNLNAFRWGRRFVANPEEVKKLIRGEGAEPDTRQVAVEKLERFAPGKVAAFQTLVGRFPKSDRLAALLYPRVSDLILFQNERLAESYLDFVVAVADGERKKTPGRTELSEAVARWLFKLTAYKDEYEVARLWLQNPTWEQIAASYDGKLKRYYQLHPPILRAMGMKRKIKLGNWFTPAFRMLYALKGLRGTAWDVFGYASIRREERRLIGWYRDLVHSLLPTLTHENHSVAVALAGTPDGIRGFEAIKERTIAETEQEVAQLLEVYRQPHEPKVAV